MTHTRLSGRRSAAALAIGSLLVATGPFAGTTTAQWDDAQQAVRSCEEDLTYQMGSENRGRDPQARIDSRGLDIRNQGRNSIQLRGTGDFRRDRFDRGRAFTFDCTFDRRGADARASYRWRGAADNGYDDPGYSRPPSYRPPFGGGSGSGSAYPPSGRVFYRGGILNRASGKALDVQGVSKADSANIQQWDFASAPNQMWEVIDQGNGEFSIISQASGKALDVANHNASDGANVQQFRWHNGDNQRWRLERAGNGYYQIVSVSSGRCLDVDTGKINENGGNVQQWSCSGQPNQQWRLGGR